MAQINIGGVVEDVITSEEFTLDKARQVLKDEVVAVIGYGVQGRGQALNMRDNGINVIVGEGDYNWNKAIEEGFVPGKTLFSPIEAAKRGTIIQYLMNDATQKAMWPELKETLTAGKALYFSHGFSIVYKEQTGIIPPKDIDVILVAPKGAGGKRSGTTIWPVAASIAAMAFSRMQRAGQWSAPSLQACPSAQAISSRQPSKTRSTAT